MNSEFELIDLFKNIGSEYYKDNGIIISPGDDCAVFKSNKPIVTSIDASVEGVHFPKNANPSDICLLYTSPSPRDKRQSRMPSSA